MVTLKQLAEEFGIDRSNAIKWVKNQGITPDMIREGGAGQKVLAVGDSEAETLRERRRALGFSVTGSKAPGRVEPSVGTVYIVRPDPEARPERVKLGFTVSPEVRLSDYRIANPEVELVVSWLCKRSWEQAAMDAVTNTAAKLVKGEVYDTEDLDSLRARGDAFFMMMPNLLPDTEMSN